MDYIRLGENIRKYRKRLGLTQEKLSEAVNITAVFLSQIENASRRPSLETVISLANVFDTSVDTLLFENNEADISHTQKLNLTIEQMKIIATVFADRSEREVEALLKAFTFLLDFE